MGYSEYASPGLDPNTQWYSEWGNTVKACFPANTNNTGYGNDAEPTLRVLNGQYSNIDTTSEDFKINFGVRILVGKWPIENIPMREPP